MCDACGCRSPIRLGLGYFPQCPTPTHSAFFSLLVCATAAVCLRLYKCNNIIEKCRKSLCMFCVQCSRVSTRRRAWFGLQASCGTHTSGVRASPVWPHRASEGPSTAARSDLCSGWGFDRVDFPLVVHGERLPRVLSSQRLCRVLHGCQLSPTSPPGASFLDQFLLIERTRRMATYLPFFDFSTARARVIRHVGPSRPCGGFEPWAARGAPLLGRQSRVTPFRTLYSL